MAAAMGTCGLTNSQGVFVKSHLIPKAFTRPEEPGLPLIQGGAGQRAVRRWDSWYDARLVTRRGEDLLAKYDDWAVSFLRGSQLVWSGWGSRAELGELHKPLGASSWGVRHVAIEEPKTLRLFFLSLLWRAAATKVPEFSEVELPAAHLDKLRELVVTGASGPPEFYPVSLTQLSTRGLVHNMAPIADVKIQPEFMGVPRREIPIFRFYFDGLIAHFARQDADDGWAASLGNVMVGQAANLIVSTVTYEYSFQNENLRTVMAETVW